MSAASYRVASALRRWAGVAGFAAAAALLGGSPLSGLERSWGLESLYSLRGIRPAPAQVVVIALQGDAARALGVAPRPDRWPRALHAELVERLQAHGARAVAFDLLFDRARDAQDDARLAAALRTAGNGVLVAYLRRETQHAGSAMVSVDRLVQPLPLLSDAALATAPFALVKRSEGVLSYLAFAPQGDDHPSLPLVLAALAEPEALAALAQQTLTTVSGSEPPAPHVLLSRLRREALADPQRWQAHPPGETGTTQRWRQQLADPAPEIFLNLYGPPGLVRTVAYDQALAALREGGAAAERFRGATVLVGASEFNQPEQRDVYRTPWSTDDGLDISGVELGATALANQLDGSVLRPVSQPLQIGLMAALAALCLAPWRVWRPRWAAAASVAVAGGYAGTALWAFGAAYLWLPWALPLGVVWPASVVVGLGLRLWDVERHRTRLRLALDRYGPRDEVARLARQLRHGDDTVYVACLSSDIEDYTQRVEGREPGEARRWLNAYFETVFPIVRAHGGHVVDHAGDAMVCIWLSGDDPGDACRAAARTACALHAAVNDAAPGGCFDPQACPTRLGVHFGPVSLGDVGDAQHAEQRVVGDIVNTASRIQSANKTLGTRVLVSDRIAQHLPPGHYRDLGQFQLSGKQHAVGLAEPTVNRDEALCAQHARALDAWERGDGKAAQALAQALLERWPHDGPTQFLLTQLAQAGPPTTQELTPSGDRKIFVLPLK
ncbi:MAG: adenylate/guanylate cyclase domain-containing protein [Pseudomonadota bacterium]